MFDFLRSLFFKATSLVVSLFFLLTTPASPSLYVQEIASEQSKNTTITQNIPDEENIKDPPSVIKKVEEPQKKEETTLTNQSEDTIVVSSGEMTLQIPDTLPKPTKAPTLLSASFLNEKTRAATVNIFCLTKTGGILDPISGSGVIINEKGVIITSAHVAQYYLLKDYLTKNFIDCVVRIGSPAVPAYRAELFYIPPIWIEQNAEKIKSDAPMGTGEYDFALLRITGPISEENTLPSVFPFIEPANPNDELVEGSSMFLAGYSAGFIDNLSVSKNLWISTSIATLKNIFVFRAGGKRPDLLALSGTATAQEGSSGGAVVDFVHGKLWGLIAARTEGNTTGERELRAISIFHIDGTLQKSTGKTLAEFISGDLARESARFNSFVAPRLTKILTDVLDGVETGY